MSITSELPPHWRPAPRRPAAAFAITADVLLRQFLRTGVPDLRPAAAGWLSRRQQADGGWAVGGADQARGGADRIFESADRARGKAHRARGRADGARGRADGASGRAGRAPGAMDLAGSIQAYLVLRLAGDPPEAYHMALAAGWIRDGGGPAAADPATRIWLALFGLYPWPKLYLRQTSSDRRTSLPGWPGPWTAHAILPVAVIGSVRPVLRVGFDLSELRPPGRTVSDRQPPGPASRPGTAGRAQALVPRRRVDAVAVPVLPCLRAAAVSRCADWIIAGQSRDGSWGQAAQETALSLAALRVAGCPLRHPALAAGLAWLDRLAAVDLVGESPVAGAAARGTVALDRPVHGSPIPATGGHLSDVR
jgi:hypothetical protein